MRHILIGMVVVASGSLLGAIPGAAENGVVNGVCVYANDGVCNEPGGGGSSSFRCPPGTDTADCGGEPAVPPRPPAADAGGAPGAGQPGGFNPNPMLGHNAITPPGLNPYFVGSSAGNGSPIGTWAIATHNSWSKVQDDENGEVHDFVAPEDAGRLTISADGTYVLEVPGYAPNRGRWYDIGSNVIRLADYSGHLDATASVWNGTLNLQDEVGLWYDGRRL